MKKIWEDIVSPKEVNAVRSLLEDDSSKFIMLKSLSQLFLSKDEVFINDSLGQFMLMVANAPFVRSDEECLQITQMIRWGVGKIDVFPMITEHKNEELAYRCLLSLSLFKGHMQQKTKRYGSPSIEFYRGIGINTFRNIGFIEISEDFNKWECYLGEITC